MRKILVIVEDMWLYIATYTICLIAYIHSTLLQFLNKINDKYFKCIKTNKIKNTLFKFILFIVYAWLYFKGICIRRFKLKSGCTYRSMVTNKYYRYMGNNSFVEGTTYADCGWFVFHRGGTFQIFNPYQIAYLKLVKETQE